MMEVASPGFPEWKKTSHVWAGFLFVYANSHPNCAADGFIRHDRIVLERKIGKFLRPDQKVRHVDGDDLNDEPGNLELISTEK